MSTRNETTAEITLTLSTAEVTSIDAWAITQRDSPARNEAIRRLLQCALRLHDIANARRGRRR
jgi:hypothetical protein